jgi:transcriptional regulator with XRE-family HTH domain
MEKSTFSEDYILFLSLLKSVRKATGLTQKEVAERLGQTQSFVSKCERGERRIDIIEMMAFCKALGIPFETFTQQLTNILKRGKN